MAGLLITYGLMFSFMFVPIDSIQNINPQPVNKIDSVITALHDQGEFNGVMVLANKDEIQYKKAMGKANFSWNIPNTIDTRFRIASITKTFTASLILHLIESGKLNFNDVITDHLPDYPSKTGDKITIEHLLTQTSGIPDYLSQPNFMETKSGLNHDRYQFPKYFQEMDLNFEPGSDWDYGNSDYYLLGLIIENITGLTYESAMTKYILEPAGLKNTGFVTSRVTDKFADGYVKTSTGYEIAKYIDPSVCYSAGMMYSNALDLVKFTSLLYTDKRILSESFVERMTTIKIADYGYGVYIGSQILNDQSHRVFVHMGEIHGYTSQVTYFPDTGYTLVILDNTQQCPSKLYFSIRDWLPDFFRNGEPEI